jgi:hypothetical protein
LNSDTFLELLFFLFYQRTFICLIIVNMLWLNVIVLHFSVWFTFWRNLIIMFNINFHVVVLYLTHENLNTVLKWKLQELQKNSQHIEIRRQTCQTKRTCLHSGCLPCFLELLPSSTDPSAHKLLGCITVLLNCRTKCNFYLFFFF